MPQGTSHRLQMGETVLNLSRQAAPLLVNTLMIYPCMHDAQHCQCTTMMHHYQYTLPPSVCTTTPGHVSTLTKVAGESLDAPRYLTWVANGRKGAEALEHPRVPECNGEGAMAPHAVTCDAGIAGV
jgi:hypothetical protein